MRFRTTAIATTFAAALTLSGQTGSAFSPHKGAESPTVAAGRAPRLHRTIAWRAPAGAQLGTLATWRAIWDRDTDVPARMWGPSIAIARSTADAAVAEAAAKSFLAEHISTLAPGASPNDFVVTANELDPAGHIRSVGFAQYANGLRVYSGSIGFVFERDHLIMVGSTALPNVSVRMPATTLPAQTIANAATAWLARSNVTVAIRGRGNRVIVPIVHARAPHGAVDVEYRVVETISVESTREAGRWDVWVDANDAAPVARRSTLNFATGTISFDVPDRYPGGTRGPKPAPNVNHTVNGVSVTSAPDGSVTWATGTASVSPGLAGPRVAITNKAGALVQEVLQLPDGGNLTWSKATDPVADAQLDAFVFASTAKAFTKTRLNPNLTWLDGVVSVNVNEPQTCNAYSTGDDIHFFTANAMCENTGRIADVVYHEFGHSVHANSIIDGVGAFDGSLSEGLADTLAVSITGDHGMGRGFFFNDTALRDVDPVGVEKRWPDDADGEPHDEGEIIGEALYDLRKALETKLGQGPGFDQFLVVYYGVMQRSSDIPTSYAAALVADDDDGNLANGTPNQCELDAAFALHGLTDPAATLGLGPPTRDGSTVSFTITPPSGTSACPPPTIASATLSWVLQSSDTQVFADLPLAVSAGGTIYSATIPTQPDGSVVLYHVTVDLSDGSKLTYPQNPADQNYQMYVGPVQVIKCFDFEGGAADWTHGATPANRDEWQSGVPLGIGGDPKTAHGGANVFGIDLGSDDGQYRNNTKQWAQSPDIDLGGATAVRLQYYRWLGVEDGAYDDAAISVNEMAMWSNHASPGMPTTEVNHTDKEWRFQDVDISAAAATGKVHIKFELDSDQGLAFGGWTIDDVCIVAVANPALCGNGVVDPGESCDDGNKTDGDGCTSTCVVEACPDSGGTGTCDGGGCCSSTRDPSGAIVLSMFTVGLVLRRRRRRATLEG